MRRISAGPWLSGERAIGLMLALMATCVVLAAWHGMHHRDFMPLVVMVASMLVISISLSAQMRKDRKRGLSDAAWVDGDILLLCCTGRSQRIALADVGAVEADAFGALIFLFPCRSVFQSRWQASGRSGAAIYCAVSTRRADAVAAELLKRIDEARRDDGR